jgi:hypothetical protein
MGKATTLFGLGLALAVIGACQAATLVDTNFTQNADGWQLNGNAKLLEPEGSTRGQALSLTQDDGSQVGVAWTTMKTKVPSFSFIAEVEIRHPDETTCPAEGFAMAFAPVEADVVGGLGASLGLFGGIIETFTAFEVNTWTGQGLGTEADRQVCNVGKNETFGFDVINPNVEDSFRVGGNRGTPEVGGAKIGQVNPPAGMKIVNGGVYRYQWNVAADGTHTVYVTGLDDKNKQFQKVKVLEVKFPDNKAIEFEGRFGLSASTGGAFQHTEIYRARVDSPVLAEPL